MSDHPKIRLVRSESNINEIDKPSKRNLCLSPNHTSPRKPNSGDVRKRSRNDIPTSGQLEEHAFYRFETGNRPTKRNTKKLDEDLNNPDLYWAADVSHMFTQYIEDTEGPYLVLTESRTPNHNLGKYGPLAIGKLIAEVARSD